MSKNYTVFCLSEAMSPITHSSGTAGNESLVMRQDVVTPRGVMKVPSITGNALRHRMIREPGARWLVDRYELAGKLSLKELDFLFHGGSNPGPGGREDTAATANVNRLFPLFRLLGGTIPGQILHGSVDVGFGYLVCEENRKVLLSLAPDDWPIPTEPLRFSEECVSGFQYVRGLAEKSAADILPEQTDSDYEGKPMIFAGQAVARGSLFFHRVLLRHVTEIELGCLLHAMSLWQVNGGTVGGKAAIGHGVLKTFVYVDGVDDFGPLVHGYIDYADSVKDEAVAFLMSLFRKPVKEAKAKGKARATVAVADGDGE